MHDIENIKNQMKAHNEADNVRFADQKTDLVEIKGDIKVIKENHLSHIQESIAEIETNMSWLIKTYWVFATAGIGGLITGIFNLIK